jgi:hypothetical protein
MDVTGVNQAQKDKGRMFSLIHGRQIQKITPTQKQAWSHTNSGADMCATVDLLHGTRGGGEGKRTTEHQ